MSSMDPSFVVRSGLGVLLRVPEHACRPAHGVIVTPFGERRVLGIGRGAGNLRSLPPGDWKGREFEGRV